MKPPKEVVCFGVIPIVEYKHMRQQIKTQLYVSTSNVPENWFETGNAGYLSPVFSAIKNGIGNGTITAFDIKTGKTKWVHPTEFPTWVSPAVSGGVVYTGHITNIGTPYKFDVFGTPAKTPLLPNGIIMALDKDTGKTLWQFRVGTPIGIGGPSSRKWYVICSNRFT